MVHEQERVNHPKHYDGHTSLECIDVMETVLGTQGTMDFCLGNAFKYVWRYRQKNGAEDLEKAKWYLDKYVELYGGSSMSADCLYQRILKLWKTANKKGVK